MKKILFLSFLICSTLCAMDGFNSLKKSSKRKMKTNNERLKHFLDQKKTMSEESQNLAHGTTAYHSKKLLSDNLTFENSIWIPQNMTYFYGTKQILQNSNEHSENDAVISTLHYLVKNNTCIIKELKTNTNNQKQGYASLLLHNLEQEMIQAGCKIIEFLAVQTARSFYEKHGYSAGRKPAYMQKTLPQSS